MEKYYLFIHKRGLQATLDLALGSGTVKLVILWRVPILK